MAQAEKAPSDRIAISQRIDQRMDNPKRRKLQPTEWKIKGELFLNCSCTTFCPCVVSLGAHPPTEGYCHAWMAIAIDEGHFEGEDLGGLNVGLLVDIPGKMAEGNWKVAAYVDERATQKAYNGILKIFSGQAGGNSKYWMGPDIIAAQGLKSRVRDYGRVWDFGGKSAEICPIDWQGPKP